MDADLDTLVTALYVKVDDELATTSSMPGRPPLLTASELVCLAVMQAMLGVTSERRWLRYVGKNLPGAFAHLPGQAGYNKRLRAALPLIKRVIRMLAADTDFWHDTVWITDSTPVECGRSRPTALRSHLAGWAGYGYCASHPRLFWGLGCIWCGARLGCRSCGPWPTPRSMNVRYSPRCWTWTLTW